jgi:shikimate dehydrogenase
MHNAGYAALGLPFTYVAFATEDLEGALRGMRALGIRGFGVSMPFKIEIIPLLDGVDELAGRIGAVNTVVNDEGALTGYNTDASGSVRALAEAMPLRGRRVALIGAGGAARAVAHALCAEGVRLHVINRTQVRARELAQDVAATFSPMGRRGASGATGPASGALPMATAGGLDDLKDLSAFDAIVNCSSAGMRDYGEASPVPETSLRPELVVMDIVYEPIETELIRLARRRGAKVVHGGRMLLHQACAQFQLYTGRPPPEDAMNAALERVMQVKSD